MSKREIRIRMGILLAGALSLGYGIWREELVLVFRKAAAICMECIGIG